MEFFSPVIDWFKGLLVYLGAFVSGIFAEKYHDTKEDLSEERKRDKIDAQAHADPGTILEHMRDGKL